jgi:hypothetical protein
VRFEVPVVGSSFASALLDVGEGAGLADHALKRFSALKDA